MNKKRILMIVSLVLLVSLAIVLFVIFKNKDNHNDKEQKNDITSNDNYKSGIAVYYNPETNTKCSSDEEMTNVTSNGDKTEIKTGCMKWYIFNDDGIKDTVNMILDHNTTAMVEWTKDDSSSEWKEAKESFESDTSTWSDELNARLISSYEIAKIVGDDDFDGTSKILLDEPKLENGLSQYSWLYNYTTPCLGLGCEVDDNIITDGYWLSDSPNGWMHFEVSATGLLSWDLKSNNRNGIRPVITVKRESIK